MTATTMELWPLDRVFEQYADGDEQGWDAEFADLVHVHGDYLDDLTRDIAEAGIREAIRLGDDGRVWDGHHRLLVAQRLGMTQVPVVHAPHDHAWDMVALTWDTKDYRCDACGREARRTAVWVREDGLKRLVWPPMPD